MPYKAPPIRLDETPKKENTKPELACKEKDILLEHLRWPNTVFARALADAIQRAHQDCKRKQVVDTDINLFAQWPLYLC